MKSLVSRFQQHWPTECWKNLSTIVAVSGGSDSVALLSLMHSLQAQVPSDQRSGRLIVAHFNHRLRRESSDEDAQFVRKRAEQLNLEFFLGTSRRTDTQLAESSGIEESARDERYQFFRELARQTESRLVVTAHHWDDQVETILHRILRGTSIAGLAGMPHSRELMPGVGLVRPLLPFHRAELLTYLQETGQPYRTDSTNADTRFTRNHLRHETLPALREAYGAQVEVSLTRLASNARECQSATTHYVQQLWDQAVEVVSEKQINVKTRPLDQVHEYFLRALCVAIWTRQQWPRQGMTQVHWQQLSSLIRQSELQSITLPGAIQAVRTDQQLQLFQ